MSFKAEIAVMLREMVRIDDDGRIGESGTD